MNTSPLPRLTRISLAAAIGLASGLFPRSSSAADLEWILDGTGAFTTGANWSGGTFPELGDTGTILNGGTAQITTGDDLFVDMITVIDGGLDFSGGSLTTAADGDLFIGNSGGTASLTMNGGTLNVTPASLRFGVDSNATVNATDAEIGHSGGYLIFAGGGSGAVTGTFSNTLLNHSGNWFIFGDGAGSSATVTFDNTQVVGDAWTFFGKGGQADVTFRGESSFLNPSGATIVGEGNPQAASGILRLQDSTELTHQGSSFFPVGHNGGYGTLEMSGESSVSVAGEVYIGNDDGGNGLSNGTLIMSGDSTFSTVGTKFVVSRWGGTGNVELSGTTTLDIANVIIVGENGTATMMISDSATAQTADGQNIYIGSGPNSGGDQIVADGTVTLNGGNLIATNASVILGLNNTNNAGTNNVGILNLNGGTVTASGILKGDGDGTVNFNGGTVKTSIDNADYFSGFASTDLHVQNGGLKFDTNGPAVAVGISQDLDGAGGLQKVGDGTLIMAGASTFTGATVVSGGTLVVSGSLGGSSILSIANVGKVELENNLSLNDDIVLVLVTGSEIVLSFDGIETIGALSINGTFLEVGEYTLEELQAEATGIFTGNTNAVLNVTAVPEPGVVLMLGLGAAFLVFYRRRRRNA